MDGTSAGPLWPGSGTRPGPTEAPAPPPRWTDGPSGGQEQAGEGEQRDRATLEVLAGFVSTLLRSLVQLHTSRWDQQRSEHAHSPRRKMCPAEACLIWTA